MCQTHALRFWILCLLLAVASRGGPHWTPERERTYPCVPRQVRWNASVDVAVWRLVWVGRCTYLLLPYVYVHAWTIPGVHPCIPQVGNAKVTRLLLCTVRPRIGWLG